jgi:hypothetical protein
MLNVFRSNALLRLRKCHLQKYSSVSKRNDEESFKPSDKSFEKHFKEEEKLKNRKNKEAEERRDKRDNSTRCLVLHPIFEEK